jgi:hypothetical protein
VSGTRNVFPFVFFGTRFFFFFPYFSFFFFSFFLFPFFQCIRQQSVRRNEQHLVCVQRKGEKKRRKERKEMREKWKEERVVCVCIV